MASEKTNGAHAATNGAGSQAAAGSSPVVFGVGPPFKGQPEKPPKANREGITKAFTQLAQWAHAAEGPFPTQTGHGTFSVGKKVTLKQDLKALTKKDVKTIVTIVKSALKGEQLIDDKTMIMEHTIRLVAGLPHGSRLRAELTNNFINGLWNTLDHPPLLYMGDKHQYRQADGSWNNPMNPMLGAAGSNYARSCRPSVAVGALPDPELIFETIMKRTNYRKHPNNVSSVLWYWADIVIHDLFWTDQRDINKNKTSSFLDLSPLYGSNQEMQDSVRTFKDGLMKPDTYADKRLLGQPPGVSVILIMFNRFHNYIATNLAAINEAGRFTPPSPALSGEQAAAAWKKYDNDLFQTARLITSGLYINITLVDYVRNIVNLNRSNTTWTLDPRAEMGKDAGTFAGVERGTGSMVSAEFNLCYRWHSCISAKDDQWIKDFYATIFEDKDPLTLTLQDMGMGFAKFDRGIPQDPAERVFGGFKRGADGKFSDDDLVGCISDAIEDVAGAFGSRNVPQALKPVEIMGILQGRKWNVAGLNEFRKHFGLKPWETFEDINSDPEISGALRHLYGHPDFVELYPGLVAEEAKAPMAPGVGIAPTYTISRVILSDAVCLTRGDRFYTTDYNPRSLTSWGFNEVAYDLNMNQGCVFYKLFIRAFPNHFKRNSAYAHYPMCVPGETEKILTNLGRVQDFNFERPTRQVQPVKVTTCGGAKYMLDNPDKFKVNWEQNLAELMGPSFPKPSVSGDSAFHFGKQDCVHDQLYRGEWTSHLKAFYSQTADRLVQEKSYKLAGANFIDVVKDVGHAAPVHFAARTFGLPLKTKENPKGVYTEQELYAVLALLFMCTFYEVDPVKSFPMRQTAKTMAGQLGQLLEAHVKSVNSFNLFAAKPKPGDLAAYGATLVKGLAKQGMSARDIAWHELLPAAGATVPNISHVFSQSLDHYLTPEGAKHLPELYRIANLPSSEDSDSLLLGYCMEGIRLSGTFGAYREAEVDAVIPEDDGSEISVQAKHRVFVNFAAASKDAKNFPSPDEVNPRRPLATYVTYVLGPHTCLAQNTCQVALTEMFRAVFRLKNLRRAPGAQGELKRVRDTDGFDVYMREDRGAYYPFPSTMVICYNQ
ncbi:putative linoleate diol synthase [Rosellinia necatrix]|uniref:Putative linoleate diol synthase n=1 Tax=Rosellinia necatrix TaxID=77044 RepID=A0A1W2TCQ9_ROSNE|nr:putative linoleate diol synthase [Rosellinia necatrix]